VCGMANAQPVESVNKKELKDTEQEEVSPDLFEIRGFAREKTERIVRKKMKSDKEVAYQSNDDNLNSGGINDNARKINVQKRKVKTESKKKIGYNRNRDIETLMGDLTLARIQKPVFRGIMTEHLGDVVAIIKNETLSNVEKNVQLKQLYGLRNKRLMESLNDEQYEKWMTIKDDDDYLALPKPEDY
jgi:hypothetical protein